MLIVLAVRLVASVLAAITELTLMLRNFTLATLGPEYSPRQPGFVAVVSLALYGMYVFVQAALHTNYFQPPAAADVEHVHRLRAFARRS